MRILALGLAMAAACGSVSDNTKLDAKAADASGDGGTDSNDGAHSGTRLKLRSYLFPDGTKQWLDAYDTMLSIYCVAYPWADGNTYCSPYTMPSDRFSDAGCTTKIGYAYTPANTCSVPSYISDFGCGGVLANLYAKGTPLAITTVYYKSGASCLSVTAPTTYSFFSLGAAVPASQFVQLTTTAPMGTGAFPIKYLQSADGFQAPKAVHDTTNNFDCNTVTAGYGATTAGCAPGPANSGGQYSDAACSQAETFSITGCPAQPYASVPSMCAADLPMYSTPGATVAASPQYDWNYSVSPPVCTAETAAVGETFYATGAPFTLGAFTRAPDTTSGLRMENIHDVNGATRVREFTIYDTMLHSECFTQQLPDGSYECVPTSSGVVASFFTDAGCSAKVDLDFIPRGPSTCPAPPLSPFVIKDLPIATGQCEETLEVHQVGTAFSGTLYSGTPGNCVAFNPATSFPSFIVYQVGAVVPQTSLATATLQTDP